MQEVRKMVNKDKLNTIINYLKIHDGYQYKVYNRLCSDDENNLDSILLSIQNI